MQYNVWSFIQFVIVALLIAAVAADQAYPKPAYPAAYPKSYDYVSYLTFPSNLTDTVTIMIRH